MRIFILCILTVLGPTFLFAASAQKETVGNIFQIEMRTGDQLVRTQSSALNSGLLLSRKSRTYFFAQEHPAQSLNSVKIRAEELSVNPKDIKLRRTKNGTIFFFEDKEYTYFYSTKGGRLLISQNEKEKFDASRVHLKLTRGVASK